MGQRQRTLSRAMASAQRFMRARSVSHERDKYRKPHILSPHENTGTYLCRSSEVVSATRGGIDCDEA